MNIRKRLFKANLFFSLILLMSFPSSAVSGEIDPFSIEHKHGDVNYIINVESNYIEIIKNSEKIFKYSIKKDEEKITAELTNFQKQSIDLIKTVSLQFILIAVGVFSLTGIYMLKSPADFNWKGIPFIIIGSYVLFGISIYYGYRVYGNIIWQLAGGNFDSFHKVLTKDGIIQFYCFFIAGLVFIGAIFLNFLIGLFSKKSSVERGTNN